MRTAIGFLLAALSGPAFAQGAPAPTTANRPAREPAGQTSIPSPAPPASTTQTTGATDQDPAVKDMNAAEKAKVEQTGK